MACATAVVDRRFCAPHATAFTVTKALGWMWRDFTVTDDGAGGAAVMHVEAARFSCLPCSLFFLDAAPRRPVLTIEESPFHLGRRWEAFRGDSTSRWNRLFVAANKTPFFQLRRTTVHVFLASNGSGERFPDFVVHGSYYDGAMAVSRGGTSDAAAIARSDRPG